MAQNNPEGQNQRQSGANQSGNQGLLNPERRGYGGVVDEEMPGVVSPDAGKQAGTGQTQGDQGDQNQGDRTKP